MGDDGTAGTDGRLQDLLEQLLVRDRAAHAEAIDALADAGDERVVPHLVELVVIDAIANEWERFGFPEVLRQRAPPRYLELPEVRWPGVREALATLAAPDFDSPYAWVEWESWYSQQQIEPLDGFDAWKLRLYRSYLPPVGGLLDVEPRSFDLQDVRWGNCDRSFLAALNAPAFRPADDVAGTGAGSDGSDTAGDGGDDAGGAATGERGKGPAPRPLRDDDLVFGFEVDGTRYAVPRWVLFPHELLNAELRGVPVSLTFCTLCNAPILYERRVDGRTLTFGSTGMLLSGNKVMYDEETETLWDQHAGVPLAGHHLERDPDLVLDVRQVTQTDWGSWREEYPETLALDPETGYGYDYGFYDGNLGIFRHYWEDEDVVPPGVPRADGPLPEKAEVYGVVAADASAVWVVPVDDLDGDDVVAGTVDGREVVALLDPTGDVAVYEAPPTPAERGADGGVVDATGTEWTPSRAALEREDGEGRERVVGRHGLWFAFRTHYDEAHVLGA